MTHIDGVNCFYAVFGNEIFNQIEDVGILDISIVMIWASDYTNLPSLFTRSTIKRLKALCLFNASSFIECEMRFFCEVLELKVLH
jgi:hypothetical protein